MAASGGDLTSAAHILRCIASDDDAGLRLDRFLAARIETLSRARLQDIIRSGHVAAAGRPVQDPSAKVRAGDAYEIAVPEAEPSRMEGEAIALDVVYEDAHILVIDKPAGLVVHPGAGNPAGTLVNALIAHCGDSLSGIGGVVRPGIVHRLDKDTSGLMVVAKNDGAHRHLAAQFADHGRTGSLLREYLALVWGEPQPRAGRIETQIARHPASRHKMAVAAAGGRNAVTYYGVEKCFRMEASGKPAKSKGAAAAIASLVRCRLETGRTHQVRVHMAHLGAPIVADPLYGAGFRTKSDNLPQPAGEAAALLGRQALHAAVLQFQHPATRKQLAFASNLPADIANLCKALESLERKVSKN